MLHVAVACTVAAHHIKKTWQIITIQVRDMYVTMVYISSAATVQTENEALENIAKNALERLIVTNDLNS